MDMGTGKTRTTLEYIQEKTVTRGLDRVVWLCPVSCKPNLLADIAKHCDYTTAFIENYVDEQVCIVGIESISGSTRITVMVRALLETRAKCLLVVDESHMIKNPMAKRTRRILALAKLAYYRLLLTGTPTPLGVWDLYSQMLFLDKRILNYSSWYAFAANHCEYSDKYPGLIVKAHNPELLTRKIAPYIFQVTKAECLDLPPKSYSNREFELCDVMSELYDDVKVKLLQYIDDLGSSDNLSGISYLLFTYFGYLHRVSSGYFSWKGEDYWSYCRAEAVKALLTGIDLAKDKVIIWHRYKTDLELLKETIAVPHAVYNGSLSSEEKLFNLKKFGQDVPVLIANLGCGAYGLNLQVANYAIYYNSTFDYARRLQAEDRIYRIGQGKNVHIIDVLSNSGIDRKLEESTCKKASLSQLLREKIQEAQQAPKGQGKLLLKAIIDSI